MCSLNNKATARDVILIGILVFGFGIAFFVLYNVFDSAVDKIVAIPAINSSPAAVEAFQGSQVVLNKLDYVIFALFIGLVLALIITSWFIGGEPIFMFIYFIFIVISVVVAAVLSNAWESFTGASIFGLTIAAFPITNHILMYLPIYIAVSGFIGVVAMFAKPYVSGGY